MQVVTRRVLVLAGSLMSAAVAGADRLYNLARLGYYDDTRFHRVDKDYIVQ